MKGLEDSVRKTLVAQLRGGSSLLMGVSGGPDSTALFCALASLSARLGLTLAACIVDHGIRPKAEIEQDFEFVRSLCDFRSVPLSIVKIPEGYIKRRVITESRSLEEVAREERHRLLQVEADRLGADWVALGHTQDDVLETVLMRFLQGSDVGALAGIPPVRGRFIRPLLNSSREDVLDYLRSLGQIWREDLTNRDTAILRNRVRHTLVPLLSREFPGFRSGILSFSRKAALVTELLQEQGRIMCWTGTAENGYSIPKDSFFAAPGALRVWELMRLYDSLKLSSSPRRLPWRFLSPVLENWLPQGTVVRGHGVELLVRKSSVTWQRCIVMPCKRSYFIEVTATGTYSVPEVGLRISFVRCSGKGSPVTPQIELRAQDIEWPLVLRSRRRGDEILLERGTTPLKELFAGWTLPEGQRQLIPILADRKGVVAVLGRAFGYPDRMRMAAQTPREGETDRIIVRADREEGREQQQRQ